MQWTLTTLVALLATSPVTFAALTKSAGQTSSSGSSSASPSSSSSGSQSSSSGGQTATPSYTITGLNPAQSDAYLSFKSSKSHDTSAISSLSALTASATQTSAIVSFDPYAPSVMSVLQKAVTETGSASIPSVPTNLPQGMQDYWSSIYKAEVSLLTKQATNTSNAAMAMPTAAVMAAGAGVLGAVGLAGMM